MAATEIEQWHEGAETWRRLAITFPPSIVTHSTNQVFYYDAAGLLRRMDYVAEVNGAAPVGQYNSGHREFAGLTFPTRRRIHRRDPDNTCDMTYSAITLDVRDVEVDFLRRP